MRRRDFIAGLGSAATWPVVARAQQPAVIGVLGIATAEGYLRQPFQRKPDFGVTSVNYDFAESLALAAEPR